MFALADAGRHHALALSDRFGEWLDIIEGAWRAGSTTMTFSTSGSTGKPKRCTHALAELDAEARYFAGRFGEYRRVLAFAPAHHIYGFLFSALLPEKLGVPCLDTAAAIEALATLQRGDLIVAFPERWFWIERVVRRWPCGVHGVTSTAPCPRDLIAALTEAGLGGFSEVYGSSETAGIGVRSWPETAYRLLPRWRFADDEGEALTDEAGHRVGLPDSVERQGTDTFVPIARRDGAVQVGGVNVYPDQVAAFLRTCPGVTEAAVRPTHSEHGLRLKAFVVPNGALEEDDLRARLADRIHRDLQPASRPCNLVFGDALPRNAIGKLSDW